MRKIKKCIVLLIVALLLVCLSAAPVRAEDEDYTYTVRFYSGQQGTFKDGSNVITITGLKYNDLVTFNPGESVILNDNSKYYIKGIRESGKDNNISAVNLSFSVKGDMDYVVAYGLERDKVSYTVNYIDVNGNALASSDIYYGSVGDKPVVAYLYIEGYLPQAYNLTKYLVADAAENVFTFVYTPLNRNERDITTIRTVIPGTTRSVVEVIPGETVRRTLRGSTGQTDESQVTAGAGQADAGQGTGGISLEEVEDTGVPRDMIDLDEPEVPLSDMKFNIGPIEADARILFSAFIIIMAVLVIAVASWWYWGYRRKKENNEK